MGVAGFGAGAVAVGRSVGLDTGCVEDVVTLTTGLGVGELVEGAETAGLVICETAKDLRLAEVAFKSSEISFKIMVRSSILRDNCSSISLSALIKVQPVKVLKAHTHYMKFAITCGAGCLIV